MIHYILAHHTVANRTAETNLIVPACIVRLWMIKNYLDMVELNSEILRKSDPHDGGIKLWINKETYFRNLGDILMDFVFAIHSDTMCTSLHDVRRKFIWALYKKT